MSKFADYRPGGERPPQPVETVDVRIRPAGKADLMRTATLAAEREGQAREKWIEAFHRIHDECVAGRAFLLVATLGQQIVGYGKAGQFSPPADAPRNVAPAGWYLTGVVVHPEHRRRGLGSRLTRARLDWIRERSPTAYYFANARNRVSIDLHQAVGFVELTRDFWFPRAEFEGGLGILFVCTLGAAARSD